MSFNLVKTVLILTITINSALACLPMPGSEGALANMLVVAAANKYQINLLESKVTVKEYSYNMKWKFTDAGLDCHDTDIFKAEITFDYKDKWDNTSECQTTIQASLESSPKEENGKNELKYELTELAHQCGK